MKHKTVLSRVFRKRPEEDGNAAMEFALVLPFLLAILMGMVEFGRVLFNQQVITNAARDASRASATDFEPYLDAANRILDPAGIPRRVGIWAASGSYRSGHYFVRAGPRNYGG